MSKVIFDLIQRFEVENGIPRLVSSNIQVIEGGEDLMSLATSLLVQLGFYDKFEEKRTSQYVGYRLKNPAKGDKRYQLVLAQRKECLDISIPRIVLQPYLLEFSNFIESPYENEYHKDVNFFWVRSSKEDIFLEISNKSGYGIILDGQLAGYFDLDTFFPNYPIAHSERENAQYFQNLTNSNCCLKMKYDKLFPYTLQASVSSSEELKEFIKYFANILMNQQ